MLRRFRQVFTAVRAHFQQVEKQVGIGGAQVWALGVIAEHPGIGVGSLARAMHIHQSTASNLVRGLVERGLVRTERGQADRRTVYLQLQPEGAALLARAPADRPAARNRGISPNRSPLSIRATTDSRPSNDRFEIAMRPLTTM